MAWTNTPLSTAELREIYLERMVEYAHEQEEQEERFDAWLSEVQNGAK